MADNFDLKKFLKESKALENLNPSIKAINEEESRGERASVDKYEYEKGKKAGMKAKIKEMIVAELEINDTTDAYDPTYEGMDADLEEAKKKDKVEDVEVTDTEITDTNIEDVPAEDVSAPESTGGIEDIAADMKGTEADLMDHLMKAFQIAKGMQNEKLETQVGNTLKFFVSEYIGGGEQ